MAGDVPYLKDEFSSRALFSFSFLAFGGYLMSSITWPFGSPYVISYWWSIGTEALRLCLQPFLRYSTPKKSRARTRTHTDRRCKWVIFCPVQFIALDRREDLRVYWKRFGKQEVPTEGTGVADRSTCTRHTEENTAVDELKLNQININQPRPQTHLGCV